VFVLEFFLLLPFDEEELIQWGREISSTLQKDKDVATINSSNVVNSVKNISAMKFATSVVLLLAGTLLVNQAKGDEIFQIDIYVSTCPGCGLAPDAENEVKVMV